MIDGGQTRMVALGDLEAGRLVLVSSGARVPADGISEESEAELDESKVTGESRPVAKTTGDKVVGFTVNQPSIVYVLYDDAITGSHRASWLADFTDTGDNITDSSGHTFSVYYKYVSSWTIWLGGNTSDGVNGSGLMYDVLIQPLL